MNKIDKLNFRNFTKFKDIDGSIEFCSGINIFIGTNGTGKTHLLKSLYLLIRQLSNNQFDAVNIKNVMEKIFKTDNISNLIIKHKPIENIGLINLHAFNEDFWIELDTNNNVKVSVISDNEIKAKPLYIPPQEMLSTYFEFIPIYENYKTGYELVYYDFAKALSRLELNKIDEQLNNISVYLQKQINGELIKDKKRFYIEYPYGKIETPLIAEGIKKFATIDYLMKNGSITKDTIIFWDEPEVHFNPKLLSSLTAIIKDLANLGIQLFITTHDHLLSQQISQLDEYRALFETKNQIIPEIKFFLLTDSDTGTQIKSGSNLTDLHYNPILEEYLNYHDKEQQLFNETLNNEI